VPDDRAPRRRPVDHERLSGRARRGQQGLRARQVRRHRLLHHHRQPALERADSKLHRASVVGEYEDGVEVFPVEQRVVARQRVDAAVRAPQALAQAGVRIGRGHDPAELAGGDRGEIAPDVIVGQSQNPDAQPGHVGRCLPHAAVAIGRSRELRERTCPTDPPAPAFAIPGPPSIGASNARARDPIPKTKV
jgi:hypothetical protein